MINGKKILKYEAFRCLGSVIQKNDGTRKDVNNQIKAGWLEDGFMSIM